MRLVQQMAQATQVSPEVIVAFLEFIVERTGPNAPRVLAQIVRMPPQQLRQMLEEFAQSPAGMAVAQRGGPSAAPLPPPPMGGPNGVAVGGLPPGVPGGGPGGGPPPGVAGPPQLGSPQPRPLPQEVAPKKARKARSTTPKAPPWEPLKLPKSKYGSKGPSYAQVIADADEGAEFFKELVVIMQDWRDIYHGAENTEARTKLDRTGVDMYQGDRIVQRAQPVTMANRIIGMTAPTLDRLGIQVDPWSDDDASRNAAQNIENWARSFLEELYRRYNRRATVGEFQPPLPRKVAGLATIEGGFGWRAMPDPEAEDMAFPWQVEPVPLMELMPRPRATTRQVTCTLAEAYTYQQVQKLLPPPKDDDPYPPYSTTARVRLTTWTDENWWAMALDFADSNLTKKLKERNGKQEYWVYPPAEHKLGRRIYLVPNPWDATPLGPSATDVEPRAKHLSRGVYAPILKTIILTNKITTALEHDVFRNVKPPMKWKINPELRERYKDIFPELDYDQAHQSGGNVVVGPDEEVAAIVTDLAASPSGQALLQSLLADMGDVAPPVMSGRGPAESGFDRFQKSESAGVLQVDPIIQYLTDSLEYLLEAVLTDLARFGEGEDKLFTGVPYKVYRTKGSTTRAGYRSTLTAKEIRKNGPYLKVTFKRLGLTERMQLAQLNLMLVKEHFKSRLSAMDEMGIDDTEREMALMLAETTVQDPAVIKAMIRTALEQQAAEEPTGDDGVNWNRVMLDAFVEEQARQTQPPVEKGLPSPAGAPGGNGPMPGSSSPSGVPPVMAPQG